MVSERGRVSTGVAVLIAVVGVAAIAGIILFVVVSGRNQPQHFYFERRSMGQRLLAEIEEYDLVNGYPETAEEVIYLNNLLMRMFYGKIVSDTDLLYKLVGIQRQLFSSDLTTKNSHQSQWETILDDTEELYGNNVYLYLIDVGVVFTSNEADMCSIPLTFTMINYETLYWNYVLKLENGQWKIHVFNRTDSTFLNILEE